MKKWTSVSVVVVAGGLLAGWLIHQDPRPAIAVYRLSSGENPPFWLQRIEQRREVRARIEGVGGWEALKQECVRFVQTNRHDAAFWARGGTNNPALPPAIAALRPMYVSVFPPNDVSIDLYGMGMTKHRGIANYELAIACGPERNPEPLRHYGARTYRKIRDGIFESY
jgi:hypothetical protein